jgi:hypothetical protein
MTDDKDEEVTPEKPVIPQFPTDRIELNDIPVKPTFPADRIEKGEKPGDFSKKDD